MTLVRFDAARRGELGAPGTRHWAGHIATDEYVPELSGSRALDVFERMRRSDGMVAATLRAIKLPLLQASWEIDAASDDEADRKIAEFVRWNLFEGLSHSWKRHAREALTMLDFGFSVFELVWDDPREVDGAMRLPLRKIAPRLQRTIAEWKVARDGGLEEVKQNLYGSGTGDGFVRIPISKLAIYVNEQEGSNWTGKSILRTAYKHWFIKDQLYRIQAINAERFGVGIPVVKVGPDDSADAEKLNRAEAIGEGIRAHEKGNVSLPHDWDFKIAGIEGRALDVDPIIRHHDRMIAVSVLAQWLTLGDQGSNALSGDHSSFFVMAERAVGDEMTDVVNRFVVRKLVDANFPRVTRYPRLVVRKIETRDLEKFFNALSVAAGQMLITPDEPTENELRALAGLRPLDRATARERTKADPPPQPQPEGQPPGTEPPPAPARDDSDEDEED